MPRISRIVSAITSSATLRVFENGALNTGIPRSAAASRSTWSVPMQKQPIAISRRPPDSTSAVSLVRDRIPTMCAFANRVDERLTIERRRESWRRVAVVLERRDAAAVHAFEQDDGNLVLGKETMDLHLAGVETQPASLCCGVPAAASAFPQRRVGRGFRGRRGPRIDVLDGREQRRQRRVGSVARALLKSLASVARRRRSRILKLQREVGDRRHLHARIHLDDDRLTKSAAADRQSYLIGAGHDP